MLEGPPKVGELLLQHQLVTHDQLQDALVAQGARGGRLGSVLIELGFPADRVAQVLAAQQGVHAASERALRAPSTAALGAVSGALCRQYEVLPLQLVDGILHLAMRDPQLEIIGRLGRALGIHIQPYVVAERLIYTYLEQHYQIPRPARYCTPLSADGQVAAAARISPRQVAMTGPPVAERRIRPAVSRTPSPVPALSESVTDDDLELVFLDGWDSRPSVEETAAASADLDIDIDVSWEETGEVGIVAVDDVLQKLGKTSERDVIIAQLLRPVIEDTTLVVVFRPRGKLAIALGASGTTMPLKQVRQLMLPLSGSSLLAQAFEQRITCCGDASTDPLQPMITNYLRAGETAGGACVVPLCIKDKVVNLIVVQASRLFTDDEATLLERISDEAARGYARLIARKKG